MVEVSAVEAENGRFIRLDNIVYNVFNVNTNVVIKSNENIISRYSNAEYLSIELKHDVFIIRAGFRIT